MARVAVVTGGARGIGAAVSKALKAAGWEVAKALAQDNASKGATVKAIRPGNIATEMVMAAPKDVLEKSIVPPKSRFLVLASRRRSLAASCSSLPTTPASSPARC